MMQANKIYNEDCLTLLQRIPNNTINLIYIDPPFNCKRDQDFGMLPWKDNNQKPNRIDEILPIIPEDKGTRNYLRFMYSRIKEMHRVLRCDGSIYVHCDWRVNSYLRLLLDEVFGRDNFRNEIAWEKIKSVKSQSITYGNVKDSILLYSRNSIVSFNQIRKQHNQSYIESMYRFVDDKGRSYRLHDFTQKGQGSPKDFGIMGILTPPVGKHWIWSQEKIDEGITNNLIVFSKNGTPQVKRYLDEVKGEALSDIWIDVNPIGSVSVERVGYPTQKPEALLERIIKASSNPGDLVADFFCGSGTTLAVAEKLGRKWIGCDSNKVAVDIATERINKIDKGLFNETNSRR